jgi:lipopolysaccharide transport system ATP-binding protein
MDDTAIRIENLSKRYSLGVINSGTFFRDMQTLVARKRGRPDPHSKLGYEFHQGADSFWALKDLSFDIRQGDRLGIIGKNGAGKSTLLKLISRISAPTEGAIKIKGRVASLLEVGTGFHKELTGRENIYLNGAILGMKKKKIDRKLDEIIDFSGIERHIDTPVKRYSSGMYVRLGFAVAAHLDSEILIADEVLAVGDAKFQQKALGKMNSISQDLGRTILFVSHNMAAVQALCNKGMILERGRLVDQGDIAHCVATYNSADLHGKSNRWEGSNGDHNLKLTAASLSQDSKVVALDVRFTVTTPNLDYIYSVLILNVDGTQLCVSTASDFLDDEEYEKIKQRGDHLLRLLIDTSIFATGEYYIEFDFAVHNLKRITSSDLKLYFEVYDQRNHRHPSPVRMNVIEPNWNWARR